MQRGEWKCLTLLFSLNLYISSGHAFQMINVNSNRDAQSTQINQVSMLIQQTCDQITGQNSQGPLNFQEKSRIQENMLSASLSTPLKREPAQALVTEEPVDSQFSVNLIRDHLKMKTDVISLVRKELAEQNLLNRQTAQNVRTCATEIFGSDRELVKEVKSCVKAALVEKEQNPDLSECSTQTIDIESIALMFQECLDR